MLTRILKWFGLLVAVVVLAAVLFLWWASGGQTDTAAVSPAQVTQVAGAPRAADPAATPTALTVMTFNIGYGRGPAGDLSGPWTREHILRHLDGLAAQIADSGADLVAMQEVDLASARSHDIDEAGYLLDRLGWPARSCSVTWENNYVPFPYWPPSRHYGRMKSGQCVLSRWPIARATRYRQDKPANNPFWRNWFYLDRAIDHVVVTLGERELHVFNVHLEAFDAESRRTQAERLVELVGAEPSPLTVVLGDFNALPPDAPQRSGFPDEPDIDYGDDTIARVAATPGLTEVLLGDGGALTHPADTPNRRLDYIFHRAGLTEDSARVLSEAPVWSDHLPVVARFRIATP
ncbi:MAG: hypothetical protein EP329_26895 [Deltaproteobacteria bacterium]|nr:MAG: hypothetical protein EP329_26895 [Deltaproteobacteria bacterium]